MLGEYRRFDTMKNIRLYIVDIYKEINKKGKLSEMEINYYKLKLSLLKEIANIIKTDNDIDLKQIKEDFNYIKTHGIEAYEALKKLDNSKNKDIFTLLKSE